MADPEIASRKVLMSPEAMAEFYSRTEDGRRVVWDWGEPDEEGFYTPTITVEPAETCLACGLTALTIGRIHIEGEAALHPRTDWRHR